MQQLIEPALFYSFAAMCLAGAFGILLSRNIVRAAVWLLATLASAAGIYFMLGAPFVGAIQLIVYAGGTAVLIIFGVMLTSRNPKLRFGPRRWEIALAAIVFAGLAAGLSIVLVKTPWSTRDARALTLPAAASQPDIAATLTNATPGVDGTRNIGNALLSTYLVPFEAISVLLLAVLIGAAYLARPRVPGSKGGTR